MSKLQTLRKQAGMTQGELAERTGINRVTIARYEIGQSTPGFDKVVRIADALGVSVEELRDDPVPDD